MTSSRQQQGHQYGQTESMTNDGGRRRNESKEGRKVARKREKENSKETKLTGWKEEKCKKGKK
jgi:hypothetical protein